MDASLLVALREDLAALINTRLVIRLMDNEETTGTILAVTKAFVEINDEADKRIVRLRLDQIRSVDDPEPEKPSVKKPTDEWDG